MDDITFVPALSYRDPKAALDWLAHAFDFELTMAIDGPDGDATQCHYEMGFEGRGRIMIGAEWNEWMRSPASVDGHNTTSVHVDVTGDIDAHCERARAAGATIARRAVGPVLRRPRVPLHRPRGPPLDVLHARARRDAAPRPRPRSARRSSPPTGSERASAALPRRGRPHAGRARRSGAAPQRGAPRRTPPPGG